MPRLRRRLEPWMIVLGAAIVFVVSGAVIFGLMGQAGIQPTNGPATYLAGLDQEAHGEPVDGISCGAMESLAFHVHAHLAVYVDGQLKKIPAGVGITPPRQTETLANGEHFVGSGGCFYWLHTHTDDGIIHIESPVQRSFTLGEFFDIWNLKLSRDAVGAFNGKVTVYVDGNSFNGDPRSVPLQAHTLVQFNVGKDVAPQPYTFPQGL